MNIDRKQLLAYEKNFSTNKKEETGGFQGVNKVQEQLQKVFNKNLKIEKSEYVVEEEEEKKPPNKNVMNKVVNKQPKFPSSYEKQVIKIYKFIVLLCISLNFLKFHEETRK